MESFIYWHNQKLTSLFYLINLTMLICFAGTAIKSKKLSFNYSTDLFLFISLHSPNQTNIIDLTTNFFLAVLTVFISYYFLDKNLYHEYKFLINSQINNIQDRLIKLPPALQNKINYFIQIFILSFSSLFAFLFYTRASKTSIVNDVLIQVYTVKNVLSQPDFEAAESTHTYSSILIQIYVLFC